MRSCLRQDLIGDVSHRDPRGMNMFIAAAKTAACSKTSWAGSALSVVVALTWGVSGLLLIPALFVASFGWHLLMRSGARAANRDPSQRPIQLPDPLEFSDASVQVALRRLTNTRQRVATTMREGPRGPEFDLSVVERLTPAIENRIVVLAARAEYLASFLAEASLVELHAGLEEARSHERQADDPEAKALYRRLIGQYESHDETIHRLETEKQRFLATIDCLLATLEALPAKMTHVQSLRLAYGDEATDSISDAAQICERLSAFEQAFERR